PEVRDRVDQPGRGRRTDESVRGGEPLPREGDELPSHLRRGVAQPRRGPRPARGAGGGAAVPRESAVDLPRRRGPGYDSDVNKSRWRLGGGPRAPTGARATSGPRRARTIGRRPPIDAP